MRRIGVLSSLPADDPEATARMAAFRQALQELGWTEGRNVRIDIRWGIGDPERLRRDIAELLALAPDVILTSGSVGVAPLQQATRTVPIVFVQVTDPVGAGLVESLAQPGGNATGFTLFEYSDSRKWLELLKQIAPAVKRAAVLRDPTSPTGLGQFAARELIIGLAARHRLPAVYAYRSLVVSGGLVSYGTDATDHYRQAAGHVDRILKGERTTQKS
jgi:putative ABC transport system substrate-binding protein